MVTWLGENSHGSLEFTPPSNCTVTTRLRRRALRVLHALGGGALQADAEHLLARDAVQRHQCEGQRERADGDDDHLAEAGRLAFVLAGFGRRVHLPIVPLRMNTT